MLSSSWRASGVILAAAKFLTVTVPWNHAQSTKVSLWRSLNFDGDGDSDGGVETHRYSQYFKCDCHLRPTLAPPI